MSLPFVSVLVSYLFGLQKGSKKNLVSEDKKQPSSLPPVRNPFKAPGKADKSSEWKKIQEGETDKGEVKTLGKSVESESSKKSNSDEIRKKKSEKESDGQRNSNSTNTREGEAMSCAHPESWRDKKLPPGMKIKKQSPDEDKKLHSSSEVTAKGADDTEGSNSSRKCESVNEQQTEKETKSKNPKSHDKEERAAPEQNPKQKTEGHSPYLISRKTSTSNTDSRPGNIPKKDSRASPGSTLEGVAASLKPVINIAQKKTVKSPFGDWSGDDDDDDVQLVSVQPGSQQTSVPAAPLQKTLTSYPGFQLMSKSRSQEEDSRALHNQLTAQLKQKKVLLVWVLCNKM